MDRYDDDLAAFWDALGSNPSGRLSYVVRHPGEVVRALADIRRLPVARLELGASREAGAFRSTVRHRGLTRHDFAFLGAAVLNIPEDPTAFTEGRRQQTLRRMLRKAEQQGIRCRAVEPAERQALLDLANRVEQEHPDPTYRVLDPHNDDLLDYSTWRVCERNGTPLLLAVLPTSGGWALLRYFRTLGHSELHSLARWAAIADAVDTLAARGVQHLLDTEHPAVQTRGLRHFQRMAGFRYVRLRTTMAASRKAVVATVGVLLALLLGGTAAATAAGILPFQQGQRHDRVTQDPKPRPEPAPKRPRGPKPSDAGASEQVPKSPPPRSEQHSPPPTPPGKPPGTPGKPPPPPQPTQSQSGHADDNPGSPKDKDKHPGR